MGGACTAPFSLHPHCMCANLGVGSAEHGQGGRTRPIPLLKEPQKKHPANRPKINPGMAFQQKLVCKRFVRVVQSNIRLALASKLLATSLHAATRHEPSSPLCSKRMLGHTSAQTTCTIIKDASARPDRRRRNAGHHLKSVGVPGGALENVNGVAVQSPEHSGGSHERECGVGMQNHGYSDRDVAQVNQDGCLRRIAGWESEGSNCQIAWQGWPTSNRHVQQCAGKDMLHCRYFMTTL